MGRLHRIAFGLVLALVAGCGLNLRLVPTNDRYDAMCQSWVNDKASNLIVNWGEPTRVAFLGDGTRMMEWDSINGNNQPPETVYHFDRARVRHAWCSTRFVVAQDDTIKSFAWNGENSQTAVGCYTTFMPPATQQAAR